MPSDKEEDEVNIFEDSEDYYQFLTTLDSMSLVYDPDGKPYGPNYTLYAYCLMSNHVHLLIREREDKIGMAIKKIASSYVYYYNYKYSRDGHLFRERFKSEPTYERTESHARMSYPEREGGRQ